MDPRQRNILSLVLMVILVVGSWALFWPPKTKITQGLDLQGGLSVILTAQPTASTPITNEAMQRATTIVQNRVDKLGASEASVQRQGNDSILIQLPGVKDAQEALKVLGSTGQLEFVDVASITDSATVAAIQNMRTDTAAKDRPQLKDGTYQPIGAPDSALTGGVIKTADVGTDSTNGQIVVNVTFDTNGTKTWANYTAQNIGKQVAIVLDGVVQSAPVVQSAIPDGRTQISGSFTADTAKYLATVLQTGALPVSLKPSDTRVVGPTLGQDSLRAALYAALAGLAIVSIYVMVFYRALGALAVIALAGFASLYLGALALLSNFGVFAMSLPGLAGVVLTIGVASDTSILIIERFREEIRMGKTYRSAATSGSRHAIGTSIDADLVTFVSALVLYVVAIGPVRGFAFTLILGIVLDLTTALLFTRPSLILLAESVIGKAPAFWGVAKETVQVAAKPGKPSKKGGVANA
jgi:protein-export membrane protein SecD